MTKDQPVVTVVTPTKLSSAQHKLLRELVEQKMGKSVQIQEHIDPDLIGGITIKIGDQVFDSSIAGQLSKLESLVPEVSIVTAYPLSATAKSRLQTEVQTTLGSSVEVTLSVDPTILGGFKIKFNSREYDSTLRTKIQKLRTQLLQTKLA